MSSDDKVTTSVGDLLRSDSPVGQKQEEGLVFIVGQRGSDHMLIGPATSAEQMAAAYCASHPYLDGELRRRTGRGLPALDNRDVWVKDYAQSVSFPLSAYAPENIAKVHAGTPKLKRALESTMSSMKLL